MKKTLFLLICLAFCGALVGCVSKPAENPATRVYRTPQFIPEVILSGDVDEKAVVNVINDCRPLSDGGNVYSLAEVISKADPKVEAKSYMIFTRSSKGISINAASVSEYFLTVSGNGVVSLDCNVEVHRGVGSFPLKSVSEIMVCAETPTEAGVARVYDEDENTFDFNKLIVSRGLYVRVKDATYEGEEPLTLTLYSKRVVSASCLTENYSDCVATLENGTNVLITTSSRYNLHWANGGLFLVEFVSPIVKIDYRRAALSAPNLITETNEE